MHGIHVEEQVHSLKYACTHPPLPMCIHLWCVAALSKHVRIFCSESMTYLMKKVVKINEESHANRCNKALGTASPRAASLQISEHHLVLKGRLDTLFQLHFQVHYASKLAKWQNEIKRLNYKAQTPTT